MKPFILFLFAIIFVVACNDDFEPVYNCPQFYEYSDNLLTGTWNWEYTTIDTLGGGAAILNPDSVGHNYHFELLKDGNCVQMNFYRDNELLSSRKVDEYDFFSADCDCPSNMYSHNFTFDNGSKMYMVCFPDFEFHVDPSRATNYKFPFEEDPPSDSLFYNNWFKHIQ